MSFDIDGTLQAGDPPGPVSFDMVREAKRRGHVIGSASDRTLAFQRALWLEAAIEVDFVSHKHHLVATRQDFSCVRHIHIGDTHVDEHFAGLAGFEFFHVEHLPSPGDETWIY